MPSPTDTSINPLSDAMRSCHSSYPRTFLISASGVHTTVNISIYSLCCRTTHPDACPPSLVVLFRSPHTPCIPFLVSLCPCIYSHFPHAFFRCTPSGSYFVSPFYDYSFTCTLGFVMFVLFSSLFHTEFLILFPHCCATSIPIFHRLISTVDIMLNAWTWETPTMQFPYEMRRNQSTSRPC